jgi:hypothetical protein
VNVDEVLALAARVEQVRRLQSAISDFLLDTRDWPPANALRDYLLPLDAELTDRQDTLLQQLRDHA